MKLFPFLILLTVLASCGAEAPVENNTEVNTSEEVTVPADEVLLDEVTDDLETMEVSPSEYDTAVTTSNQVVVVDAPYTNPAGPVDLKVQIELDADGIIQSIEASATTYTVEKFNDAAQELIWKTLQDAETFYAAGSSLTTEAFNNAVKAL